jgi:hypothetical protein
MARAAPPLPRSAAPPEWANLLPVDGVAPAAGRLLPLHAGASAPDLVETRVDDRIAKIIEE